MARRQAALLNIVADQFNLSLEGTPTFTTDRGYANDNRAAGDALTLGVGVSSLAKFLAAGAGNMMGAWIRTTTFNQSAIISSAAATSNQLSLIARNSSGIIAGRFMNTNAQAGSTVSTGYGLTCVNRDGTTWQYYRNGAAAGSGSISGGNRTADALKLGGEHQYQCFVIGGFLTAPEHADLYTAIAAYMAAVGVAELVTATQTWASEAVGRFPDGDAPTTVGLGANILGLVRDPVDGTWWGARGGGSASMTVAGVMHLDKDVDGNPGALLTDWTLTEINATDTGSAYTDLAAGSCQGITIDSTDQTIYVINKIAAQLFRINKNGVLLGVWPIGGAANGVAYDAIRDKLIVMLSGGNPVWYNKDGTVASGASAKTIQFTTGDPGDQLYHDPVNDWLYVSRDATQALDHHCHIWRLGDPQHPVPRKSVDATLQYSRAIEGVMAWNGKLFTACDASFHDGNTGTGVRNDNHWRRHAMS